MKKILLAWFITVVVLCSGKCQSREINTDSGFIEVDGGRLYYEMAGNGEYIVLLHDGIVDREIWNEQFPALSKYYRVVRYDRRTYGKSTDPQAAYSDIEDLNQLFIQLDIDKAIVFGMSSGGGCAIDFTLEYPGKVNALVLVGAVVGGFGYTSHMTDRGGNLVSPAVLSDPQKLTKYFIWEDPYEIFSGNIEAKEKVAKIMENSMHKPSGNFRRPPDRVAARFLSEIKVPSLVLTGEYDIPDVHAHAGVIAFGIPGARREVIMKSGHLIPIEQPEAFNESTFRFLRNMEFYNTLNSKGVIPAVQYFMSVYKNEPAARIFGEAEMNYLGYRYLQEGKTKDAIELFKLNTIAYPDSWNVFDSLGEAYLKDGQVEMAITNYRKSLELDPDNENAKKVLKEITEKK